jgi:hypothetical protein
MYRPADSFSVTIARGAFVPRAIFVFGLNYREVRFIVD